MQRIHILGICGTFMAGLAVLAKQLGYEVSGSDQHVYPPMSTQLREQGITLCEGYLPEHLDPRPDLVVIGNALSRGNPAVEKVLREGIPYQSGPEWLANALLKNRWVLAVAGTHGKTTTSSMLAHILTEAGFAPGYLIGGVPTNFGVSAHLGKSPYFVIEADEYDSAFFDKRSKFVHYHARTLIMNNLEYDHADIFPDLAAIQTQFHHLVRTVPDNGLVIYPRESEALQAVLQRGVWTPLTTFGDANSDWQATLINADGSEFEVIYKGQTQGRVTWSLLGDHNVANALAALAAAHHVDVALPTALAALSSFAGVKRRLEVRGVVSGITVYDDFAHHPTAIATTLAGLRHKIGEARLIAVLECASNTMSQGVHAASLFPSLALADKIHVLQPSWTLPTVPPEAHVHQSVPEIISAVVKQARPQDHIVIMSNKSFGGIHEALLTALK
jgi:UDP-N-acetylmuramate: L-alanyl-gamma-D-glutamyl-meso-diaminopimelate ligase